MGGFANQFFVMGSKIANSTLGLSNQWKRVEQEAELSVTGSPSGFRRQIHSPHLKVILKPGFLIKLIVGESTLC